VSLDGPPRRDPSGLRLLESPPADKPVVKHYRFAIDRDGAALARRADRVRGRNGDVFCPVAPVGQGESGRVARAAPGVRCAVCPVACQT